MIKSPSGKKYIGQHESNSLKKRKRTHSYRYFNFLKEKIILELNRKFYPEKNWPINPSGYCTILYCAFQKYSWDKFEWSVIENDVSIEDLNNLEDFYIMEHNSLHPNGYNLMLNNKTDGIKFSYETRKKMSVSQSNVFKYKLDKYRKKHKELEGVPQFVTYFESGGIRGYRIHNHPNCKSKQFADSDTPVEELKNKMLEFLKECETKPFKTVQQRKAETDVPKGITEQKPGRFLVQFSYKKVKYTKFFSQEPREKALELAIGWMENKKKELKEEGSETK